MKNIFDCTILAVDDEPALCHMITDILTQAGFRYIYTAKNCAEAKRQAMLHQPNVILLDVMLPDGDGFSLMQQLRTESDVPILFLSARDADADRLHGLGLGADDYIVKPFLPQELILRLKAVLRRSYAAVIQETGEKLYLGSTVVDWVSGTVQQKGGSAVPLTAKEYALLHKLADNRGNIVTIDALCHAAWDDDIFGYENTLMVHIRRLREKIEENPSKPRWLITVRGLGYKLMREDMA